MKTPGATNEYTKIRRRIIHHLFTDGFTDAQIAEMLGTNRRNVYYNRNAEYRLHKKLLATRRPTRFKKKYTDKEREVVKQLREEGWTAKQIGKKLQRTANAIYEMTYREIRGNKYVVQNGLSDYLPNLRTGYTFLRPDTDRKQDNSHSNGVQKRAV